MGIGCLVGADGKLRRGVWEVGGANGKGLAWGGNGESLGKWLHLAKKGVWF